ncbi:hypothetical protein BDV25DRAFT_136750 [Aspergillus avenaceus]|uniref:Uncharacterized protein n=1 Tax=Aspergillus avenaceus TaxID=36643 RepID=A0A5N6U4Y4_ASPAV|nr:hypothetical protein BDV25DRAFT_136750 [Aspergillus avenaceus]
MPDIYGMIDSSSGHTKGQFFDGTTMHNVRMNIPSHPRFQAYSAKLTCENVDDLTGKEWIKPESYVGETDMSIELEGPSSTATITGLLSYPIDGKQQLFGDAVWSSQHE